ncbi:MAG: hypothetical protein PVG92_02320 [Holophagae bacterium]|jgi:hypothetical protein
MSKPKSKGAKQADGYQRGKVGDKKRAPIKLLAAAWAVPGLGHWLLGCRKRAVVFAVVVVVSFTVGVLLEGELGTPKPGRPFSWLASFACFGNGLLYFIRLAWLNGIGGLLSGLPYAVNGGGDPSAVGFAYGNTFLYTAGLMNLLTVLDASDIAKGAKE